MARGDRQHWELEPSVCGGLNFGILWKTAAMNPELAHDVQVDVTLTVNGEERRLQIAPWVTLLDLLRENFKLTGTKKGCDHGQCGACTVLINGKRINSCLVLAVSRDNAEITTVEGLGAEDSLHQLQAAFVEHDAFQCGYCTPGQICSAAGLLREGRTHSREEIREHMSGNLCRCGAYTNIADAIDSVLKKQGTRSEAAE
jgi:xanthine dehydrogenase YagT iron-sulfur-binding subunit